MLRIPQAHIEAFKSLLELPDAEMNEFFTAISSIPIGLSPKNIINELPEKYRQASYRQIIELGLSINMAKLDYVDGHNEFIDELIETLISNNLIEKKTGEDGIVDNQNKRINLLFSIESLSLTAKALKLGGEFGNYLIDVKSLTDIRPVFSNSNDEELVCSIITHQFKIVYFDDSDRKEFFLNLDSKDLSRLSELIVRAQKKENTLRGQLKDTGLNIIKIEK